MLAIIAAFVFVIDAVLAWVGGSSLAHVIAIGLVGLALVAVHLAFRVWAPAGGSGRRWYW